ncbi:hypothetical protein Tco_1174872 [Tanacetum coccineum]
MYAAVQKLKKDSWKELQFSLVDNSKLNVSCDDEEDTRNSHEYLNDLEEEYQTRALLAKSKRFYKKEEEVYNEYGESESTQTLVKKMMLSSKEACHKMVNEKRIMGVDQLTKDPSSSEQKDIVFVKSSADDTNVTIPGVERPWLSKAEGFILPNHDTGRILPAESQRNTTDPLVAVTDSLATIYYRSQFNIDLSSLLRVVANMDSSTLTTGETMTMITISYAETNL